MLLIGLLKVLHRYVRELMRTIHLKQLIWDHIVSVICTHTYYELVELKIVDFSLYHPIGVRAVMQYQAG